jgi:hypothetical protein
MLCISCPYYLFTSLVRQHDTIILIPTLGKSDIKIGAFAQSTTRTNTTAAVRIRIQEVIDSILAQIIEYSKNIRVIQLYNINQRNAHYLNQYFNFLIFLCLLHVSNPKVHLQEHGCIYSYGMVLYLA